MPPAPTRKTYRRITAQDNASTLPKRVTFPVGTFTQSSPNPNTQYSYPQGAVNLAGYVPPASNPATAAAGQLGAPYGTAPARLSYVNAGSPRGGQPRPSVVSPNLATANSFSGWNAQNAATVSGALAGQSANAMSLYRQGERGLAPISPTSFRSSDRVPQAVTPVKLSQSLSTNQIPSSFSPTDISYWQSQGYDVNELAAAGLISYNASTNKYVITQAGMEANSATQAAQQPLSAGQYVNPQGQVTQGATPFGTNTQGQRLDASGNVWDPRTATRDIYGGQFIQVGEVRWERVNGKLRRVRYGKGNTKTVIKGGGGNRNNQSVSPAVSNDGIAVSNAFLNVATG